MESLKNKNDEQQLGGDSDIEREARYDAVTAERFSSALESTTPQELLLGMESIGVSEEKIKEMVELFRDALDANFAKDKAANNELLDQPLSFVEMKQAPRATRDKLVKERESTDLTDNQAQERMLGYQINGTHRLEDAIEAAGEMATPEQVLEELERKMESMNEKYPPIGYGTYGFEKDNYLGYHTTGAGFMEAGILLSGMQEHPADFRALISAGLEEQARQSFPTMGNYEAKR